MNKLSYENNRIIGLMTGLGLDFATLSRELLRFYTENEKLFQTIHQGKLSLES